MQNILFVCLGNIARSTMAEAMLRQMITNEHLTEQISVDSAGTANWEMGKRPHPGTQQQLRKHHIPFDGIIARQITPTDFQWADYIITMDQQNVRDLIALAPSPLDVQKIHLAFDIVPTKQGVEIADPWYTQRFDITFAQLSETLPLWFAKFKQNISV
ncbi:low molecular weight protein-tyrosine-phosphatase [Periweissella beninensis]|uniref:protein-tyrosine-phosphatase n=1 Tax=Periweissella beninensis TaxID=504936 RepID=A0ABT0VJC0_9LACO|nr:low molecular weight protein-tyrosine-phosphatase [Periweissella beninensis]MBM7543316.1 protein-tyrosine phosphatase [Periweissella beninensis]MCM2437923.1 low molecular weight phosphotyrosine protein phosphatase [Periweissella beninensis]MCT4395990.1 low molecular weight phosphotyrosine protein phosphatase [Periweissella beninensis]